MIANETTFQKCPNDIEIETSPENISSQSKIFDVKMKK